MTGEPKVSVITCVLNRVNFIDKCIESVEQQTYPNIEHVFIDAFSTDGTLEKITAYIKRNPTKNIKLYQYPPKGIANALNLGFSHATGDIIHYLHSDDYFIDNKAVEAAVEYFATNPEKSWITGNGVFQFSNGKIYSFQLPKLNVYLKIGSKIIPFILVIHHENTFVTRDFLKKYGEFDESNQISVEFKHWFKAFKNSDFPLVVNRDFTVFIVHKDSASWGSVRRLPRGFYELYKNWAEVNEIPIPKNIEDSAFIRGLKKLWKELNA